MDSTQVDGRTFPSPPLRQVGARDGPQPADDLDLEAAVHPLRRRQVTTTRAGELLAVTMGPGALNSKNSMLVFTSCAIAMEVCEKVR